jgi:hypothetical protein
VGAHSPGQPSHHLLLDDRRSDAIHGPVTGNGRDWYDQHTSRRYGHVPRAMAKAASRLSRRGGIKNGNLLTDIRSKPYKSDWVSLSCIVIIIIMELFSAASSPLFGQTLHLPGMGTLNRTSKHQTPFQGTGLIEPQAPQALIAATVHYTNYHPEANRENTDPKNNKYYAPLSTNPQVYTPKRNEWAFRRVDSFDSRWMNRGTSAGKVTDHIWFTAVNGLSKDDEIAFGGIVTNAQNLDNPNQSEDGAGHLAGAVSGVNTGPETIFVGDVVYLSPEPFKITDQRTGTVRPGFTLDGQPMDKFFGATITLRMPVLAAFQSDVKNRLRIFVAEFTVYEEGDFFARLHGFIADDLQMNKHVQPMVEYTRFCACKMFLNLFVYEPRAHKEVFGVVEEYYKKRSEVAARYDRAVGSPTFQVCGFVSPYGEDIDTYPHFPSDNDGIGTRGVNYDLFSVTNQMNELLDSLMQISVCSYVEWMQRFGMGTAMNTSAPGSQLDILLGYFSKA